MGKIAKVTSLLAVTLAIVAIIGLVIAWSFMQGEIESSAQNIIIQNGMEDEAGIIIQNGMEDEAGIIIQNGMGDDDISKSMPIDW
jgi:hypothetical protein